VRSGAARRSALPLSIALALALAGCGFAVSEPPRSVAHDHATLDGSLFSTKNTGTITYWFEWGTTAGYGNVLAGGSVPAGLPNESFDISKQLDGLAPATTYHFRICAWDEDNLDLKGCSVDRSFTTAADDRPTLTVYEDCRLQGGRQVYGVAFTGANFPAETPGGPPVRIGFQVRFDGSLGGGGFVPSTADGDVDFNRTGTFTPVSLAEIVTWLDADLDGEQDPGEPTLAEATLGNPCAEPSAAGYEPADLTARIESVLNGRGSWRRRARRALAALPARERRAVKERYGLATGRALTLEKLGRGFGVTREPSRDGP
jgi:hypothetical protein